MSHVTVTVILNATVTLPVTLTLNPTVTLTLTPTLTLTLTLITYSEASSGKLYGFDQNEGARSEGKGGRRCRKKYRAR